MEKNPTSGPQKLCILEAPNPEAQDKMATTKRPPEKDK